MEIEFHRSASKRRWAFLSLCFSSSLSLFTLLRPCTDVVVVVKDAIVVVERGPLQVEQGVEVVHEGREEKKR